MKHRALLAAALATTPSAAAVPLLSGFGGPSGYGLAEHCLHPSDDGSYAGPRPDAAATPVAVDLAPAFPDGLSFFGRVYRSVFVNTNGNITFDAPLASADPVAYPIADRAMIAPWWADVDTRRGGQPSTNAVCFHLDANRLVVTWHDVGGHGVGADLRNDFQLIVSSSSTCTTRRDLDIEFRYHRCEWAAGDATDGRRGTPAQVGFDAGNRMNYVVLPMSRTAAIAEVCTTSNVPGGAPGLHRFQIRSSDGGGLGGCRGAGEACTVPGQRGACGMGVTVCANPGTTCAPLHRPRPRACNGLDNDCDGRIDDDPALCGGRACDEGLCRDRCARDADCREGYACSPRGTCVERACLDVSCAPGTRCQQGECVDACDGVSCPRSQVCRAGHCVDPCEDVVCDRTEVCQGDPRAPNAGRCVPGCQCAPCPVGRSCQPDGRCVQDGCVDVECPPGSGCELGVCVDGCASPSGARLCLEDEVCRAGRCVAAEGAPPVDAGAASDTSTGETVQSGCGCGVAGARPRRAVPSLMALLGALARLRRRRARPLAR